MKTGLFTIQKICNLCYYSIKMVLKMVSFIIASGQEALLSLELLLTVERHTEFCWTPNQHRK